MERFLRPLPLLGLAFALRAALALWTSTLAADGAYHLATAQGLLDGRFGELLATWRMHPLNPILTAALGMALGGVEAGGAAVGVLLSSLTILPLMALARRFWNERIAGWTGLLYALHPTLLHEGTEVLNTGCYVFFFVSALAAGVFALETRRVALFALCGVASGLLYLTRPEGLLVPFFLALMLLGRLKSDPKRLALGGLLAVAVAVAVSAPYLLWLRSHTGRWTLTSRISAQMLVSSSTEPAEAGRNPAYKVFKTALKAQYPVLAPLLVLGLIAGRRLGGSRQALAWVGALSAATLAPSILLLLKSGTVPPSHRYFLPAVSLLLPWTAAGLLFLRDAAGKAGWVPVAVALAAMLVKDVGPRRADERGLLQAAAWIRDQRLPAGTPLVSRGEKMPWYAGLAHQGIAFGRPENAVADVLHAHRISGAPLLALDGESLKRYFPEDVEPSLLAAGFERVAAFEKPGRIPVRIYRWKDAR
jgi:4-amino-4-deoxy-L-arabinose transferase-like glycosyltransferase